MTEFFFTIIAPFILGMVTTKTCELALKHYRNFMEKREKSKFNYALRPGPHGTLLKGVKP